MDMPDSDAIPETSGILRCIEVQRDPPFPPLTKMKKCLTAARQFRCFVLVVFAWILGPVSGCAMLETTSPAASQATPLSWLTNWVSQPVEMTPGFDVEAIKPDPRPVTVLPENLLEITVWDL